MKRIILLCLILLSFTSFAQVKITMEKEAGVYTVPCKVNGLPLKFIFDTGASDVVISLSEALFMLKNGYLKPEDLKGSSYSQIANGDIVENTTVILKEIEVGGMKIYNTTGRISHSLEAPLLLGQSALQKLGTIQINGNVLTISNGKENIEFSYKGLTPNVYKNSDVVYTGKYDDKEELNIHKIAITQQYTIIELIYRTKKYSDTLSLEKTAKLLYTDMNEQRKYVQIIKAENLPFSPKQLILKQNTPLCFRLYFPRIQTENIYTLSFFNKKESVLNVRYIPYLIIWKDIYDNGGY